MASTLVVPDESGLEGLSGLAPETALREAVPILADLALDGTFLADCIPPLLEEAREITDWYVAYHHEGQNGAYSLQVFVWPPGSRTKIHDHATWGAYCCVVGSVLEERYERLDGASRPNHARLREVWRMSWSREDGISTVLPRDEGIHRVGNPGESTAVSVHLYGPPTGEVDGRDYDPSRDYVCDRVEA